MSLINVVRKYYEKHKNIEGLNRFIKELEKYCIGIKIENDDIKIMLLNSKGH